jgi:hypothetical protein
MVGALAVATVVLVLDRMDGGFRHVRHNLVPVTTRVEIREDPCEHGDAHDGQSREYIGSFHRIGTLL